MFEKFEGYHLAQIGRKISETIDLASSAEEGRTVIMPGVDDELDQMKRTLDSLDDFLNRVARKLSEKMPSDIRTSLCSCLYQFLLPWGYIDSNADSIRRHSQRHLLPANRIPLHHSRQ